MSTDTPTETIAERHPDTVPVEHQYEVALINEECAEVCQQVGKTLRFGWQSYHPNDPLKTNYDLLHDEMGDVQAAIEFGIARGAFDTKKIAASKKSKLAKLKAIAPPPMYVTRGSVIGREIPNESKAAIWFFVLMIAVIFAVGFFSYQQGKRSVVPPVIVQSEIQPGIKADPKTETAQECYERLMKSIQSGKSSKPADLSECKGLS